MNTININAIANSHLEGEIAMRRGHPLRSYFKRQSRRQVRHRLEAELRQECSTFIVSENRRRKIDAWFDNEWKLGALISQQQANVAAAASARKVSEVQVIRKVTVSPFARKQVNVELLVA
jgi:hypothetical protein